MKTQRNVAWWTLGMICCLIFLGLVSIPKEESNPTTEEITATQSVVDTDAELTAQQFVKQTMKNPKSAEFSNMQVYYDYGKWTVTGVVRGTNSYGGIVPQYFSIVMTYHDDTEHWSNEGLYMK